MAKPKACAFAVPASAEKAETMSANSRSFFQAVPFRLSGGIPCSGCNTSHKLFSSPAAKAMSLSMVVFPMPRAG